MKKYLWILLPLMLISLAGCQRSEDGDKINIYYLNMDGTCIEAEECSAEELPENPEERVEELLNRLQSKPGKSDFRSTIPEGLYEKSGAVGMVYSVYFTKEYNKLPPTEEVLIRAAVVRTIVQVEPYLYVTFFVDGEPLLNGDGVQVGNMNSDSFVENTGEQINTSQETELTLYFADKKGNNLYEQKSVVSYSTNKSLEKVVIEKLMDGPNDKNMQGTIPAGTNLVSINVVDGTCYVNFDDGFIVNQTDAITEEALLFSIVNSLCSLPNVDRVQIQINGNSDGMLRYNYELSTTYEPNMRLLINTHEGETETEMPKEATEN